MDRLTIVEKWESTEIYLDGALVGILNKVRLHLYREFRNVSFSQEENERIEHAKRELNLGREPWELARAKLIEIHKS